MLRFWLITSTLLSALAIVFVLGFLVHASWPVVQEHGLGFIVEQEWYPYENLFGMVPVILGSLWSILLALLIAVPLAVAAAICSAELLPLWTRSWTRMAMELMAGIPSVVYGLIGLWVLLPLLENHLDMLTGRSLLAAGLLLAMMILPTIMVLSEEAVHSVRKEQREAATNLGMDWLAVMQTIVLPQAWPSIRVATLLGLGRAMGETVAVMLVVGSIDRIPQPFYNLLQPAQTLTSRIGREMGEASMGSVHWAALMSGGLLLAVIATAIALLALRGQGRRL
ncbi:phosphate ABC transporter permease subunit PstC [Pseudomonadota bacterium]